MKNLRPLWAVLVLLLFAFSATSVIAQTADCNDPGNFSVSPPDGTMGSGTAADPYVLCSDAILNFGSEGVNPTLGLPNPGLTFMLYLDQPTETNPADDPNATFVIFGQEMSPSVPIVDNGMGLLPPGLPLPFPATYIIVPVVFGDVTALPFQPGPCSSINLGLEYPSVTFLDPAENPDCTLGCNAAIGAISTDDNTSFCTSQEVPPNDININFGEVSGSTVLYLATPEGVVFAGPLEESFVTGVDWTGEDYEIWAVAYQGDLPPAVASIDELPAGDCAVLSTNSIFVDWTQVFAGGVNTADETTICVDGSVYEYNLNFNSQGNAWLVLADENGIIISVDEDNSVVVLADEAGTCSIYGFAFEGDAPVWTAGETSVFDLSSSCSSLDFSPVVITKVSEGAPCPLECLADAGTEFPEISDDVCADSSIQFAIDGFNENYTQVYLLTDLGGIIAAASFSTFDFVPIGTYVGHALNIDPDEAPVNIQALVGQLASDVLASLTCFDINSMPNTFDVLPGSTATLDLACDACDLNEVVSISITPDVTSFYFLEGTINGEIIIAELMPGEVFTLETTNPVDYSLLLTDANGCSAPIDSGAPIFCDAVVDCEALTGGTLSTDSPTTFCLDDDSDKTVIVTVEADNGCGLVYLLTDEAGNLIALPQDNGTFDLNGAAAGICLIYTLAYGDAQAPLFELGSQIEDLPGTGCYGLSENSITIIRQEGEDCGLCEAAAGDITGDVGPFCAGSPVVLTSAGFNASYVQYYVLLDLGLFITDMNTSGVFSDLPIGTYSVNLVNIPASEDTFDVEALIGSFSLDFFDSFECSDLLTVNEPIQVVGGLEISYSETCVDDTTVVVTLLINNAGTEGDVELTGSVEGTFALNTDLDFEIPAGTDFSVNATDVNTACSSTFDVTVGNPCGPLLCELDAIVGVVVCDDQGTPLEISDDTFSFEVIVEGTNTSGNWIANDPLANSGSMGESLTFGPYSIAEGSIAFEITDAADSTCFAMVFVDAPLPCSVPCEAQAGQFDDSEVYLCADTEFATTVTGSAQEGYTDVYVLFENGNAMEANLTGSFEINAGAYELIAFNLADADLTTEVEAFNDLGSFNCVAASAPMNVNVLAPIVVSHDYTCDEVTGIFDVTYAFSGGLPSFVAEFGPQGIEGEDFYVAGGDLTGDVVLGENFTLEYLENQVYEVDATDALSCTGSISITPVPCTKTAVELLSFEGEVVGNTHSLSWTTASQEAGDRLILQSSLNGLDFEDLQQYNLEASNVRKDYRFVNQQANGLIYYRLQIRNVQGEQRFSSVVALEDKSDLVEVSIFPNPTKEHLFIEINESGVYDLELYDLNGRLLKQKRVAFESGLRNSLSVEDLQAGLYHLRISHATGSMTVRFLKD